MIDEASKHIGDALEVYGIARNDESVDARVGQFMDGAGARHPQEGPYGMAAWCVLTQEKPSRKIPHDSHKQYIDPLTERCYKYLSGIVEDSKSIKLDPDSDAYELRYVIPKICAVYEAMIRRQSCISDSKLLLDRLLDSISDNGWDYSTESSDRKPRSVPTSIVLRSIALTELPELRQCIRRILDSLWTSVVQEPTSFAKLYVLNTIHWCSKVHNTEHHHDTLKLIKDLLPRVLSAALHPTSAINIDFYDANRVRYYRLQPDLITIESMVILSPHDLSYLRVYPGGSIVSRLVEKLAADPLDTDVYGGRLSFSTCLDIHKCIDLIERSEETSSNMIAAHYRSFRLFSSSLSLSQDVLVLIVGLLVLALGTVPSYKFLLSVGAGMFLLRFTLLLHSVWRYLRKWGKSK